MIEEIQVRDLGVIGHAVLPLGPGLTVLTGETGAGKTMVVQALGLLLGRRADPGVVRAGAAQASVDGVWVVPRTGRIADTVGDAGAWLDELDDGRAELILGRSIQAAGRSRARVGGRAVPAAVLADLAAALVVVHGQSDQQRLRSRDAQRDVLDRFGGPRLQTHREAFQAAFEARRSVARELEQLTRDREARFSEAERLRHDLQVLADAAPRGGEDVELERAAQRLSNVETLRHAADAARSLLQGDGDEPDVQRLTSEAARLLERSGDEELVELASHAADVAYRASDIASSLSGFLADLDDQGPRRLQEIEDRRAVLASIIRSHGSLDAALEVRQTGADRLAELDGDDDRIAELEQTRVQIEDDVLRLAADLTGARTETARLLGDAVTAELRALALPDATFVVAVQPQQMTGSGADDVSFLLAPHPGAVPQPVATTASGGELSRVMLALEVVIAQTDPVPTFVFDEVDAGIGGTAAIEVGRRMSILARESQVIAVTHLAQVAAFADNHLRVEKRTEGGVTSSTVTRLSGAEREAEMARLLSGLTGSDAAREHARELLRLGERTADAGPSGHGDVAPR